MTAVTTHLSTASRRRTRLPGPPRPALAGLLIAGLLGGTGCHSSMPDQTPTDRITAVLDDAPRPHGATLSDEHTSEPVGDSKAVVTRTYRTTGDQPACRQLLDATRGTDWALTDTLDKPLDPDTCDPAVPNPTYTDPGNDKQRRGRLNRTTARTGGIDIEWRHDELIYILDEGSLPD